MLVLGREVVYTTSAGQHGFFPGIIGLYRRLFCLLGSPGNMDALLSHISCKARPSTKSVGRCTGEASERSLERPGVEENVLLFLPEKSMLGAESSAGKGGTLMSEHDKILAGRLFDARGTELRSVKRLAHDLCQKYNQTFEGEADTRAALLRQLLGGCGDNVYFQGPIYFNYGFHTTVGRNCFANYQFVVSDDAPVTIGDDCMFGPNVTIVTPFHPLIPEERRGMVNEEGKEFCPCYAKPVVIGNDVWVAAGVTICGGVTIGDGAVIGAGSVVLHDVPPRVLAAGNPCRVIREITDKDTAVDLL